MYFSIPRAAFLFLSAVILLAFGCSGTTGNLRKHEASEQTKTALVLIETSTYKTDLGKSLALRLKDRGVIVSLDDVNSASNYRATDFGAVLLIVSLKKGVFNKEAEEFLKHNYEANNLALYVSKEKKFMQMPREVLGLGGIDTVTSASIVHPQEDMLEHLEVLLQRRLNF